MIASGAIVIVVKIVFTRPEELYGNADPFGDGAGFEHVVVGEAAAESAARSLQVNNDVVVGNIQNFGHEQAAIFRRLAGGPKFELAVVVMCKAVFRLHRSVREERIRISGLNGLCGGLKNFFGVSILAKSDGRRFLGKFLRAAGETFTALLRSCAFVPFCLQLFAGGVGLPPSVGDYGDAPMQAKQILRALHLKSMAHAWHGSDLVQDCAAAVTNIWRHAAPTRRSGSQLVGVEVLPPARCGPNFVSSRSACSMRTSFQSTSSSSAMSMGRCVLTPWPTSGFLLTMVTMPSAATRRNAVGSKAAGGACGACAKISAAGSKWRATRIPPPATADTRRKLRRSRSVACTGPPYCVHLVRAKFVAGGRGRQHTRYCNAIRAGLVSPSTWERNWGIGAAIPCG